MYRSISLTFSKIWPTSGAFILENNYSAVQIHVLKFQGQKPETKRRTLVMSPGWTGKAGGISPKAFFCPSLCHKKTGVTVLVLCTQDCSKWYNGAGFSRWQYQEYEERTKDACTWLHHATGSNMHTLTPLHWTIERRLHVGMLEMAVQAFKPAVTQKLNYPLL